MGRSAAERLIPEVEKWLKNRKITLEKGRGKGFWILCDEFSWQDCDVESFPKDKKGKIYMQAKRGVFADRRFFKRV